MKNFHLSVSLVIAASLLMQSCVKDKVQSTYTYYTPVYKSKTEVWQNIKSTAATPLKQTGKLFLYGRYIFINEINRGVHVIDNVNPSSPTNLAFIAIPGNIDIAVKGSTLFADLYTDMLSIDISDPGNAKLNKVTQHVFPERDYNNGFAPDSTKYIVDWNRHETNDKRDFDSNKSLEQVPIWFAAQSSNSDAGGKAVAGIGGSMARFTIVDNYLYTVGRFNLTTFNISNPENPVNEQVQSLGWNIETIYPLKDKLFIGSQTGMFIYSIANPTAPALLGSFSHACFNDPVIADDDYAYVTLRATTEVNMCRGTEAAQRNELDIVNISNVQQPSLMKRYDMTEPMGLSKDGDHLFICDGKGGLKVYNASNVMDLREIKVIDNINAFDVICQDGHAIVVADEGLYQYDYSDINNIFLVSKINIEAN